MKTIIWIITLIVLNITSARAQNDMSLTITGIRETKGILRIAVFNNVNGFPSETKKAYKLLSVNITKGNVNTTIKNLPNGEYAITVFHDANNNGILDTNFFGIPREGNGISNATGTSFSKPNYSDAVFQFTQGTKSIKIELFY